MIKKIIAGLGGAIALNLLHEIVRKTCKDVPHINELGEEALQKSLSKINYSIDDKSALYAATLSGDIISNTMYYAFTATNQMVASGSLAGVAAVVLPSVLGLNNSPTAGTNKRKALTVAYYLFGAAVTKMIYKRLNRA